MIKLAVIGGRPTDGTILPKLEKHVWKELKRVLEEHIKELTPLLNNVELCFPLYSKFDIEFLRMTQQFNRPTKFYVPTLEWGLTKLPPHQTHLIKRTQAERIICNSNTRIQDLINDADIIYLLPNTLGVENYYPLLQNKNLIIFPENKMRFKTESDGEEYYKEKEDNRIELTDEQRKQLLTLYMGQ